MNDFADAGNHLPAVPAMLNMPLPRADVTTMRRRPRGGKCACLLKIFDRFTPQRRARSTLRRRELRVSGSSVPVGGRAFEIIEVLARSAGELVTKDELIDRIWPGAIVGKIRFMFMRARSARRLVPIGIC